MPLTEELKQLLENYNKGLELYRARKFEEALTYFKKALEVRPEDGPSKLYVQRCEEYIKNPPPPDWDAIVTMTTK